MNRFKAFGLHLLGSIVIGLLSSAFVFLLWYQWPLSAATGVIPIFLILIMVDVVIGPVLTLIIFNPQKKELKRDLIIVVLMQTGALIYGLHTVFIARPVYIVFNIDRFDLVYANDLSDEKLSKVSDTQFKLVPLFGTRIVAARNTDNQKDRNAILFSAATGGDDIPQLPQYYVNYISQKSQVQQHLQPLEKLLVFNEKQVGPVKELIKKYSSLKDEAGFLPLRGKVKDLTIIVKKNSAEVLEVKNLNPWP